ncbi:MAG: TetR/AcrR family transcriptional regulator [Thermoleophilaceae bacterium]|nr:TetR/AcrR family transcriptional regulator [Thermoleophilaceae bacterium]
MQDRPAPLSDIIDGPLPSGRHSLTREVVLASQRGRLLDAMAEAVAEHSYGATTIAHVVSHAGVSRKTFYEHFRDKEHCFLAMYDTGIAFVLGRLAEALDTAEDPRERLVAGVHTFLTVLADEPAFCRAIVLEVYASGPIGLAKRRAVLQVFAGRYLEVNRQAREADPDVEPLSGDVALGLVGAILELVSTRIEEGRTAELAELTDPLSDFVIRNVLATAA